MIFRIKGGLDEHYHSHFNGIMWTFGELTFDEFKVELEDVEWKMTPYRYDDLPPAVQKLTKRIRGVDGDATGSQSKRLHVSPQQLLGVNAQGNQGAMDINAISASIHRYEL